MNKLLADRLNDKTAFIPEFPCQEWVGFRTPKGYGCIGFNGKVLRVHRARWIAEIGVIPEGMHVLHKCDNPACNRIEHLFLGTNIDNVKDKVSKHRSRGERAPRAKITESMVREIRRLRLSGLKYREVADAVGATMAIADSVIRGKNWRHVT